MDLICLKCLHLTLVKQGRSAGVGPALADTKLIHNNNNLQHNKDHFDFSLILNIFNVTHTHENTLKPLIFVHLRLTEILQLTKKL